MLRFIRLQSSSNPNLDIDDIATRLGYSRSVFYRRIKALTNIAPNDFLRTYRLKRAAEMLTSSSASLSEVSDRTGFSSYSYFSKVFKKQFGLSPKDYRAKDLNIEHWHLNFVITLPHCQSVIS